MSQSFASRKADFDSHLNACGMSPELMANQIGEVVAMVGPFTTELIKRVTAQATHDQFVNLPTDILQHETYDPASTFQNGLVGTIGAHLEWDIAAALELCAAIMEDVNGHDYAAALRGWAEGGEVSQ